MTTIAMRKPHADRGMEGMVAKWYASNTAEMLKEYVDLARRISQEIPQGSAVLEVAPGPGYFCIELAKLDSYSITGLDISHTFVKMAEKKAAQAGVKVDFKQGSASKMPLQSNSFDFLLCRAAFKNFADPVGALQEMSRVLRPGGRGLIIDLKRDASPDEVSREVDGMGLSTMNRILTKLAFKTMLIKSAYTKQEFQRMLAQAQFSSVDIREEKIGFEISMTK
ncbi:MAG: class I SAM-dependent methyltransferase [Terracidiphilus sp.]